MTTAVADRSTWTEADIRAELGSLVTGMSVARLSRLLAVGLEAADAYLCNPFVGDDPDTGLPDLTDELPIPATVEEGVLAYVRQLVEVGSGARGVTSETVGSLSRSYSDAAAHDPVLTAAMPYWSAYRLVPGL